jgi:hypothetical protein
MRGYVSAPRRAGWAFSLLRRRRHGLGRDRWRRDGKAWVGSVQVALPTVARHHPLQCVCMCFVSCPHAVPGTARIGTDGLPGRLSAGAVDKRCIREAVCSRQKKLKVEEQIRIQLNKEMRTKRNVRRK